MFTTCYTWLNFPTRFLQIISHFLLLCFNYISAHHMMINSNIFFFRWLADDSAQVCPLCSQKFTQIRRKHHCRQCGKVLCSKCCNEKVTQLTVNFIPVIIWCLLGVPSLSIKYPSFSVTLQCGLHGNVVLKFLCSSPS